MRKHGTPYSMICSKSIDHFAPFGDDQPCT